MKKTLTILAAMVVMMAVGTVQANYDVVYTAELKGDSCIKFEDAMYEVEPDVWEDACLGEDGVVETDTFVVTVDSDCPIEVAVKAGKCKDDGAIDPLAPVALNLCGFTIELVDITIGTYTFAVTSDDDNETAALSNITFCFCDDSIVTAPPEGPYELERRSPNDAPGVEPADPD